MLERRVDACLAGMAALQPLHALRQVPPLWLHPPLPSVLVRRERGIRLRLA